MAVQKDFKAPCGCEIHIIKWSSQRDIASVKSCPLHKAAPELLAALESIVNCPDYNDIHTHQLLDAKAAIKKAKGE